ncbi:MAG: hypothetical protein CME26_08680 [Gemmatimonadetes bacterium]|nr:hypothetical protein [Gemmatimonadota bacterium]|tara:strand:+ start:5141 stop:5875 length:735 start_codon:yes stop_codon:yes gene_type:complete
MTLNQKVIVVTGGASGIGRAAAICCGKNGANVVVVDLDKDGLGTCVEEITGAGGSAEGHCIDVREDDQVSVLFSALGEQHGRVDGLIHAAGVLEGALVPIDEFEELTWDKVLDINLKGSFLMSKHAVPLIEKSERGVILLIASGAGVRGGSSSVAYGSSKGGVHGLSLVLAAQLADRNIRVHGVCPGSLATPLKLRQVEKSAKASGGDFEKMAAALGDPMGVGKVLAFLVSDDADYVRGSVFTR